MRASRCLAALLAFAAAGCGGTPSSPTSPAPPAGGGLPFQATRYSLQVIGSPLACGATGATAPATIVTFYVNMTADATGWTATSSDGAFTMRLQPDSSLGFANLAGTARGSAVDEGSTPSVPSLPSNGTRVTIADATPISGRLPDSALPESFRDRASGIVNGAVTFSRNGVTATCPAGATLFNLVRG